MIPVKEIKLKIGEKKISDKLWKGLKFNLFSGIPLITTVYLMNSSHNNSPKILVTLFLILLFIFLFTVVYTLYFTRPIYLTIGEIILIQDGLIVNISDRENRYYYDDLHNIKFYIKSYIRESYWGGGHSQLGDGINQLQFKTSTWGFRFDFLLENKKQKEALIAYVFAIKKKYKTSFTSPAKAE